MRSALKYLPDGGQLSDAQTDAIHLRDEYTGNCFVQCSTIHVYGGTDG